MTYQPPFTQTPGITNLCIEIAEMVGRLEPTSALSTSPTLHRQLRIETIHSSLMVEGNTLTAQQVTAILDGKRVLGDRDDIREVENADRCYALVPELDPLSLDDLLHAHGVMMDGLVKGAGAFRNSNAGVFDGDRLIHMGTPAHYVAALMNDLFEWLRTTDVHPVLRSCIFHYEFEFIHPFADGNGRTGRLWHTLLLASWRPVLAWLPVESVILKTQQEYYAAFSRAEVEGDSAPFVAYMLGAMKTALEPYCAMESPTEQKENALLLFVRDRPTASVAQIAEHLGVSRASADRIIAKLKEGGRLAREGSSRKGSWRINR